MCSSCNPKLFAVTTHSLSNDHFHTDAVGPPSDHCRTEAVYCLSPSDHYCIDTVAVSGDHFCIDRVVPSCDHYCTSALRQYRHLVIITDL